MPEIMDGKNIFDFIDPEIEKRLELLEEEEENFLEKMYQSKSNGLENEEDDDDDLSLDEDMIEAHEKMMTNKDKIRKSHQLVVGSQLPKKVRGLTETEELMQKIRWDKGELGTKFLTQKSKREDLIKKRKNTMSQKNSMMQQSQKDDDENDMDINIDDEDYENKVKILESKKKDEAQKKLVVERLKRKIQKKLSRDARVNDADRRVGNFLPKHLNSGHRGIGKTDYR